MKTKVNIGFPSLLGLAFIILKLCKVITWSWLWVLAPFWILVLLVFGIFSIVLLVAFFVHLNSFR